MPHHSLQCLTTLPRPVSGPSKSEELGKHFQTLVVDWERSPSTGVYLARQYKSEEKKANMKKKYDENVGMNEEEGDRRRSRL
jgi:hypothetical protein